MCILADESKRTKRKCSFHHSLESGENLNNFPKELKMFSFIALLGPAVSTVAEVGATLAANQKFSEDFQIIAGIGAASYYNDRSPVIDEFSRLLPITEYKDRHLNFYFQLSEQWKKLWCSAHRNRFSIQKGRWSVAEGLLRRYVSLSEIGEGLSDLDVVYDVQGSWLPSPAKETKKRLENLILRRRTKFESIFDGDTLMGLDGHLQQWSVYEQRKTWTSLPYLLQDIRGEVPGA